MKGRSEDRTNADGEYDVPDQYAARVITLSGRVSCQNPEEASFIRDRLTGLVRGTRRLQVTGAGGLPTWAMVKLNGPVDTTLKGRMLRFSFDLKAPDPRRFGELREFVASTSEAKAMHHKGNYRATPKFEVVGGMPGGYTLSVGGRNFVVTAALGSKPHTIDYATGRLYVGGVLVPDGVSYADLMLIEPGQRDTLAISGNGYATVTGRVYDTFI
jgi:hypothetical protein